MSKSKDTNSINAASPQLDAHEVAIDTASNLPEGKSNILSKFANTVVVKWWLKVWGKFKFKHPSIAQFLVFFMLSNGITVFQMILLPAFKAVLGQTSLVDTSFQTFQIGQNFNGSNYYVFDYAKGSLASGGGGGLSYFIAVQITLAIAQIINFFAQRKITFKSNNNIWIAASWYFVAYLIISFGAAALQGLYKSPIYELLMVTWKMGGAGEVVADIVTVIINSAISFWVFYPIFKLIFRNKPSQVLLTN